MQSDTQGVVPVFKLYGETRLWPTPDLLHCESIAERSRLHDWHIKAHRHADLVHVLHIREGEAALELDGQEHRTRGPTLIVVPAMTIHGFRFDEAIEGHIITLAQPLADRLADWLGDGSTVLASADFYPLTHAKTTARIAGLVEQIDDEYRRPEPGRELELHALAQALAVQLMRCGERQRLLSTGERSHREPRQRDRARTQMQRFQALVEDRYREQPSVEALAGELGITAAHLNTLCRRLTGRSPLQLLHERVLLEAKRELTYTNLTISRIADGLGFSEPAYFTRFFKRMTGLSPRAFRRGRHD
uniref:AraC family of transcriptional regulator n=2 Tax=Arhodomonas sp. Seminole TaxID=1204713 RepID=A0A076YGX9_9GAMM|nr:AraC family of transcriptional regulator [Arhodomonas sp. Seminole]